jgi:perosamine synthetase
LPEPMIPLTRPFLDERCAEAARRVILSGWVTQGPEVERFEKEFAAMVKAPHACAVSSCTSALHLALRAAGVGPGDDVITVSHSFIATANAIRYQGATPVFVDIEPGGFNMDVARLERALTPKTKAILCVHQMGMPCDLARILAFAHRHSVPVIEDAACASGSEILWNGNWEPIGRPHADAACFSFHPRKVITTGEGGMLTTAHADWDQTFRTWRQHGMSIAADFRHRARQVTSESYAELGYNYKMTDIQAAIGREQLKALGEIVERRRFLASRYHRMLAAVSGVHPPAEPEWARSNWQSYCVWLAEPQRQRDVMQRMLDGGISTRRGIVCSHREGALSGVQITGTLTRSEEAQDSGLLLPLFPAMADSDQERVVEALMEALR